MEYFSLVNVKDGSTSPLIYDRTSLGFHGITATFAKREEYGLSIHWSNVVPNVEGDFQEYLIQYSYMSLKQDALDWLRQNGMLPSTKISRIFEDTKNTNKKI